MNEKPLNFFQNLITLDTKLLMVNLVLIEKEKYTTEYAKNGCETFAIFVEEEIYP
jgi:hypothetical protein